MESDFIRWLRERLPRDDSLLVAPGDDAAVLQLARGDNCVVTADLISEGTHFKLAETDAGLIGRKALAVNLSDMAAMAAIPVAAVVSLLLPRNLALEIAQQLLEGMVPLADKYHVIVAGGDTNTWDGGLVINVTLIGQLTSQGPLLRSKARLGDAVLVTGSLGGSALGHHLTFEPRISEALRLAENYTLHAGMDISDGLALDLNRLVDESGLGADLDMNTIPVSEAARELARLDKKKTALQHALSDGEDFELLLTTSQEQADRILADQPLSIPITRIGTIVQESGLWARSADGQRDAIPPDGYVH